MPSSRTRALAPTLLPLLLLLGWSCGRVGGSAPPPPPFVGAWEVDLEPLLLGLGYPPEEVEATLVDSFWTWYFDADGELAFHRLLFGVEELRQGQWAPGGEASEGSLPPGEEGLLRLDLDEGETGLEFGYALTEANQLRVELYDLSPDPLIFHRVGAPTD